MATRVVLIAATLVACLACGPDAERELQPGRLDGPWQAVPFAVPGPMVEAIDRTCRGGFEDAFPQQTQLMVVDVRGGGRVEAQYAGPDGTEANCVVTVDATGRQEWAGGGTGSGGTPWRVLQASELEFVAGSGSAEASNTVGRAGPGIARVVIVVPGQPPVSASLANGWYVAWWPGEWPPGTKVTGIDPLGQTVAEEPIQ